MSPIPSIKFPSAIDDSSSLFRPFNVYKWRSALKEAIDASPSTVLLTLADTSDLPTDLANNFISIDDEIMFVESIDNSGSDKKITVIREVDDSVIATHLAGAIVQVVIAAYYVRQIEDAIIAIENQIGVAPIDPSIVTLYPNADPYEYAFSGMSGYVYDVNVACANSGATIKSTRIYRVTHWDDAVNAPEAVDTLMSSIGAGVDSELDNMTAGSNNFTIRAIGCNGGTMKVKVNVIGVTM